MYKRGTVRGGYTLVNDGNLPRLNTQPSRPTGVHLSGILSKIYGYSTRVAPETLESQAAFETSNLMELGTMFEFALKHWFKVLYPDEYVDPPTLTKDGIHLSPDLYHYPSSSYCEIKLTKKSARAAPGGERFAMWEQQLKSYCYADDCNVGRLMICHVNGVYAWLSKHATLQQVLADDTVFNIWERVYTDEELIANWAVVRQVAHAC